MRRLWVVPIALAFLSCSGGEEAPVSEADMLRAQMALAPFKSELVSALMAALAENPVEAIDVCQLRAPAIAESLSTGGVRVGRTSHRLRNPANAPLPWVEPLLSGYVAHPDNLDPRAVRLDAKTIGYVEPITVKPMCLMCHGEDIAPAIHERLAARYPADEATGFREGDFRGLFWVMLAAEDHE